jgi:hypothetical protein
MGGGSWGLFKVGCGIGGRGGAGNVGLKGKLPSWSVMCCLRVSQRYDPRHNRWFQIQSLQQEHADLCVCVVGRYIYAVAGRDYHNDLSTVERYDPATNSWAYVAPLKREVRKPSKRGLLLDCPFPGRALRLRCQG